MPTHDFPVHMVMFLSLAIDKANERMIDERCGRGTYKEQYPGGKSLASMGHGGVFLRQRVGLIMIDVRNIGRPNPLFHERTA